MQRKDIHIYFADPDVAEWMRPYVYGSLSSSETARLGLKSFGQDISGLEGMSHVCIHCEH